MHGQDSLQLLRGLVDWVVVRVAERAAVASHEQRANHAQLAYAAAQLFDDFWHILDWQQGHAAQPRCHLQELFVQPGVVGIGER